MKPNIDRPTREALTVEAMVRLYCRRREGNRELCPRCAALLEYALKRLRRCPHGADKPTCRLCTVHCYSAERREQMREVMRWAGPRMMLYRPLTALRHALRELKNDSKGKKLNKCD